MISKESLHILGFEMEIKGEKFTVDFDFEI